MTFNSVFYFDFYNEDKNTEESVSRLFGFNFNSSTPVDIEDGWFCDMFNELEGEYGVHDWSSSPNDEVSAIGYTSYEVDPVFQVELMKLWQQAFVNQFGKGNVTPVVFLGEIKPTDDDLSIFKRINNSFVQKS